MALIPRAVLAVVALAAGLTAPAMLTAPEADAAAPASGTTYTLAVTRSGMCLDVVGGSTADGALLQQWGCTSDRWQQFTWSSSGTLVNANSGKCVEPVNGNTASGAALQQRACGSAANQQWRVTASGSGTYQVVNAANGKCLTAKGGSTAAGAAVIQETCSENSNKQWLFTPAASAEKPTVAADGTGTYRKVQDAVNAAPSNSSARTVITVKAGTYREVVTVPADKPNITLRGLGSGPSNTVIVYNNSAYTHGTSNSASFFARGAGFVAENLTISNDLDESSVPSGAQAVALQTNADRIVLRNVRLLGDQDTFLVNDATRAYVVDSYVEGTVDFVFGGGTVVFDRTTVHEKRSGGGPITAASTGAGKKYGFLFYRSTITGAADDVTQLGRPWRPDAQVLYRESTLSATVRTSEPWTDMSDNSWRNARFLEYRNTGSGAGSNSNRPQLSDSQAAEYTPQKYLAGSDGWNPLVAATADPSAARDWSSAADGFARGATGGAGGPSVTVTTFADLVKYAGASTPYTIKVSGRITVTPYGKEIPVTSNKTIVGVGTSGQIVNGGFNLNGVSNVIIRNLAIRDTRVASDDPDDKDFDYDGIQIDSSTKVWIDHNTITRMNDGLIDSRKDTTDLTVSWNVLADNNKSFGIGWTDNVTARITIHHNWIRDTDQRNPSTDNVAYAHLYNNYLQNVKSYGNYARGATKMVLENSYFDKVKDPYYKDDTAQLKQSGNVVVNSSGKQQSGGAAFDPKTFYTYTLDPAADVPNLVRTYAGPQSNIGV
ncbi:Pectinesterase [Actinosynnema pretiosum subsp. pretiosum]|nr:Pectinesterase [Actinosynnema pretiosum subsp. pretiosum]